MQNVERLMKGDSLSILKGKLTFTRLPESLAFMGICIWNILPTTAEESGKPLGCAAADTTACASWRSESTAECMDASSCAMSPSTSKVPWGDEA